MHQAEGFDPKSNFEETMATTAGIASSGGSIDEPSRKRARVVAPTAGGKSTVDTVVDDTNEAPIKPFASLNFYGEHKKAISSLSFAPSTHLSRRGSFNSSGSGHLPVFVASSSADGIGKLHDITKYIDGSESTNETSGPVKKKPGPPDRPGPNVSTPGGTEGPAMTTKLEPIHNLFGHNRGINDITWSPTAQYVATASDDKTLRLWSAETGDAYVEFRGHTNFVFSVKFNPQSNLLVSGSFDETVKLWDVRCGECVATLPAHSNPVTGVDFNRDGTCIVSGSYDGLIRIWDTSTGECLKTVYAEGNPPVGGVRFSPNGKFVLSSTLDSKMRLYDVSGSYERGTFGNEYGGIHNNPQPRGGKCSKTYAGHKNTKFCAFSAFLASNPRRQCAISGSEDGKIYMYDLQSRLIKQTLEGHHDAVLAVDAHDSMELIASGGMGNDKFLRFWAPSKDS